MITDTKPPPADTSATVTVCLHGRVARGPFRQKRERRSEGEIGESKSENRVIHELKATPTTHNT